MFPILDFIPLKRKVRRLDIVWLRDQAFDKSYHALKDGRRPWKAEPRTQTGRVRARRQHRKIADRNPGSRNTSPPKATEPAAGSARRPLGRQQIDDFENRARGSRALDDNSLAARRGARRDLFAFDGARRGTRGFAYTE